MSTTYYQTALPQQSSLSLLCKTLAALVPAFVIGYSALIDPLINFNLSTGSIHGGVQVGGDRKSKVATQIAVPLFLTISMILMVVVRPKLPRNLVIMTVTGGSLVAFACLSMIWAKSPINTLTLAVYQAILYGALLAGVAASGDPRAVLRNMVYLFAIVVTANLLMIVVRISGADSFTGIYGHKNTLGAAAGCAFLFGFFSLFDGRMFVRCVALYTTLGAALLTFASSSKTTIALIIAAPAIAIALYVINRFLRLGAFAGSILLSLVCVPCYLILGQVFRFDSDDILIRLYGDTTFTGRTAIWDFVQDHIQQSPFFGHGFRGFWALGAASPKHGSEVEFIRTIGSSHSGFYDIALDLGMIGLAMLLLVIFVSLHVAGKFHLRPVHQSLLFLSVMIFTIGLNFMESIIMWSTFFDNLSFVLVGFLACYAVTQAPPTPETHRR